MNTTRRRTSCILALLVLAPLVTGCAGEGMPGGGPYVWIDAPTSGLSVPVNQHVQIAGHAAHDAGIARVEFWVADELHHVVENPPVTGNLARFEQAWMPPGPGANHAHCDAVAEAKADGLGDDPRRSAWPQLPPATRQPSVRLSPIIAPA